MRVKQAIISIVLGLCMGSALGTSNAGAAQKVSGMVKADGSSTVFPITEAVAEEFQRTNPSVRVTVGLSGTGGGMKKFTVGEIDVTGASRPIKPAERTNAKKHGIDFIELPVAYDGIAVVVHPKNDWATTMTVDELKRIWQPNSTVNMWSDVRPGWPKEKIDLYGPGADSGTFDYFTEKVVGTSKATRPDFTASEDDNVLVQGVIGNKYALGYFGFAYYVENKDRLNVVGIDTGKGAVVPSKRAIEDGTYQPLSRPIFIYVNKNATKRKEVDEFVKFYLDQATKLVPQVGYVPLNKAIYAAAIKRYQQGMIGTVFGATVRKSGKMENLLASKGE